MKMCRGFTLLELMVTVAVAAILATVGVPGFRDLIQNNRVTTQTNELVTALNFARTEAVKRGRFVEITVSQDNPGWKAEVDLIITGGEDERIRTFDRAGSSVALLGNEESISIRFSPTGAPTGAPAGATFNLEPGPTCRGDKGRRVMVGPSGQITTTKQPCSVE